MGDYCAIDETGAKLAPRKAKAKRSLGESFAVVRDSPKILNLALLVVSYGVSHRLFEVSQLHVFLVFAPPSLLLSLTSHVCPPPASSVPLPHLRSLRGRGSCACYTPRPPPM